MRKAMERFTEGFSLTELELKAVEEAERKNAENDEAIAGGYSVASRKNSVPEIPGLIDRIHRGISKVLNPED